MDVIKYPLVGYAEIPDNMIRHLLMDDDKAEKLGLSWGEKWVSINSIVPTQDIVDKRGVDFYASQERFRNPLGFIPNGVRFKNDRRVYLNDGHHRLYVARQRGRKRFLVLIYDLDIEHP